MGRRRSPSNEIGQADLSIVFKLVTFSIVLILCLSLGYFTIRNYAIETLLDQNPTKANLLALHKLSPSTAYVNAPLGRLYQFSAEDYDIPKAIALYQTSLLKNPYDSATWSNLGKAYETQNNLQKAYRALENATLASPSSAAAHWAVANFLIRKSAFSPSSSTSSIPLVLSHLRRVIELEPDSLGSAFSLAARFGVDAKTIYQQMVTLDLSTQLAAINWLVQSKQWEAAALAWAALVELKPSMTVDQVMPYIDSLIGAQRYEEVKQVWIQAVGLMHPRNIDHWLPYVDRLIHAGRVEDAKMAWARALESTGYNYRTDVSVGPWTNPDDDKGNLIFNSEFARSPIQGGFDWRIQGSREARIFLDPRTSGPRPDPLGPEHNNPALCVEFMSRANLDFANISQYVPVDPSANYDFSGWLKSSEITTDHGVLFEIQDIRPNRTWRTEQILGTTDWTEFHTRITTGPTSDLLLVRVRRYPSSKFDNLIRGKVWVDNISLRPSS